MKSIEMIGASGSGKTTLSQKLQKYDDYTGGREVYDIKKWNLNIDDEIYNKVKYIVNLFPKQARILFGEQFSKAIKYELYREFHSKHPRFISDASLYFLKNHKKHTAKRIRSFVDTATLYHLGMQCNSTSEYYIMSQGFYHLARTSTVLEKVPNEKYFKSMPNPDILIWIEPPPQVINNRRRKRDLKSFSIEQLERSKKVNEKLTDIAKSNGINVIRVENTKAPNSVARAIHNEIA